MAIVGLTLVGIPNVLSTGYWFWFKECVGLTGIIWYTPVLTWFHKETVEEHIKKEEMEEKIKSKNETKEKSKENEIDIT